jgi:hypothetical protein
MKKAGKESEITVGIHSDEDSRNLEVGTYNEFGTNTIPERSFIRAWVDSERAEILSDIKKAMLSVVKGTPEDVALRRLAALWVGRVQKRMAGLPPPNALSTVAAKGSNVTLIDTGELRGSIASKVDGK